MAEGLDKEAAGPSKKVRRDCQYLLERQSYGIFRSCKGNCKICKVNINVSHGGVSDVRKHLATAKHQQLVKAEGKTKFKSMPHFSLLF